MTYEAFAEAAEDALGEHIHDQILFGSTVRGETRGCDSDVDVFAILDTTDYESTLRDIAYDVTLEYGVVVSLFGEEVVLADDASRDDGRSLIRLHDLRE